LVLITHNYVPSPLSATFYLYILHRKNNSYRNDDKIMVEAFWSRWHHALCL